MRNILSTLCSECSVSSICAQYVLHKILLSLSWLLVTLFGWSWGEHMSSLLMHKAISVHCSFITGLCYSQLEFWFQSFQDHISLGTQQILCCHFQYCIYYHHTCLTTFIVIATRKSRIIKRVLKSDILDNKEPVKAYLWSGTVILLFQAPIMSLKNLNKNQFYNCVVQTSGNFVICALFNFEQPDFLGIFYNILIVQAFCMWLTKPYWGGTFHITLN
jgi:hypothetical protein